MLKTTLALALLAATTASAVFAQSNVKSTDQTASLMSELKSSKASLARALDRLDSFVAHSQQVSFETHAAEFEQAKEALDASAATLNKLKARRDQMSPAQRSAFDGVLLQTAQLSERMNGVAASLNANRQAIRHPSYIRQVQAMADLAFAAKKSSRELAALTVPSPAAPQVAD